MKKRLRTLAGRSRSIAVICRIRTLFSAQKKAPNRLHSKVNIALLTTKLAQRKCVRPARNPIIVKELRLCNCQLLQFLMGVAEGWKWPESGQEVGFYLNWKRDVAHHGSRDTAIHRPVLMLLERYDAARKATDKYATAQRMC